MFIPSRRREPSRGEGTGLVESKLRLAASSPPWSVPSSRPDCADRCATAPSWSGGCRPWNSSPGVIAQELHLDEIGRLMRARLDEGRGIGPSIHREVEEKKCEDKQNNMWARGAAVSIIIAAAPEMGGPAALGPAGDAMALEAGGGLRAGQSLVPTPIWVRSAKSTCIALAVLEASRFRANPFVGFVWPN